MSTYPDLKNETELLKIKTKDDEIRNLKYETENLKYHNERHNHENILKSFKVDKEYYKKKLKI